MTYEKIAKKPCNFLPYWAYSEKNRWYWKPNLIPGSPLFPVGPKGPSSPFNPGSPFVPGSPVVPGVPVWPGSPAFPGSPVSKFHEYTLYVCIYNSKKKKLKEK